MKVKRKRNFLAFSAYFAQHFAGCHIFDNFFFLSRNPEPAIIIMIRVINAFVGHMHCNQQRTLYNVND